MDFITYCLLRSLVNLFSIITLSIMEALHSTAILKFEHDTLQNVRKIHDLDKPGRLEDAINILVNWLQKQDHLLKKELPNEYLERMIILNKGLVERAKRKLDKIPTFKTLLPDYFGAVNPKDNNAFRDIYCCILPRMTKDYYRILFFKNFGQRYDTSFFEVYKYLLMMFEYVQANDYCNGIITVFDHTENNIVEMMKSMNIFELQKLSAITMEGYGLRTKGLHFLTPSKAIEALTSLAKQILSTKIGQRIHIHKNINSLYEFIPRDILPADYGGKERPLKELNDALADELTSKEFVEYYDVMKQAATNEDYRSADKFNDQYLGMPGSFRKLNVD